MFKLDSLAILFLILYYPPFKISTTRIGLLLMIQIMTPDFDFLHAEEGKNWSFSTTIWRKKPRYVTNVVTYTYILLNSHHKICQNVASHFILFFTGQRRIENVKNVEWDELDHSLISNQINSVDLAELLRIQVPTKCSSYFSTATVFYLSKRIWSCLKSKLVFRNSKLLTGSLNKFNKWMWRAEILLKVA